ncbi:hypothetical protein [Chryseobacterium sp. MDT2-18]|uniref:hypothetical protein n=1 Tax=Chryseobacterium sp. MDT2-18 TaxID=1259136 RepID=UPI002782C81C|nr:hypothetical protein [Chryseobacterium sp. MDT2-18]MDQ0476475.1 hypothetical protein [Chryseobacterium sp. MDT2-18]
MEGSSINSQHFLPGFFAKPTTAQIGINKNEVKTLPQIVEIIPQRAEIIPKGVEMVPQRVEMVPQRVEMIPQDAEMIPHIAEMIKQPCAFVSVVDYLYR